MLLTDLLMEFALPVWSVSRCFPVLTRVAHGCLLLGAYAMPQIIVRDVEEVDGSARVFARWAAALDDNAGVWPELLRRWVLLQHQDKLASDEGALLQCLAVCHDASRAELVG